MKNENVYLKKLKLPEKYLNDAHVKLMLDKPGTLSKKEKQSRARGARRPAA